MERQIGDFDYRLPAMPETDHRKLVDKISMRSDVPCGRCTLCCRTLIVPLAEEEYEQYEGHWGWITSRDGKRHGRALLRRPNGECVYLGENGCTIHGHAPHVCQRFDCRENFAKHTRAQRRQLINSGKLPKALFDRGREMIEQTKGD